MLPDTNLGPYLGVVYPLCPNIWLFNFFCSSDNSHQLTGAINDPCGTSCLTNLRSLWAHSFQKGGSYVVNDLQVIDEALRKPGGPITFALLRMGRKGSGAMCDAGVFGRVKLLWWTSVDLEVSQTLSINIFTQHYCAI
ncbi:hypothetical protein HZ326_25567 [Fusarium oxysporum f. sp. albedinis]|nr:hypothetical protein HZ326_25567 [Fusarium oxysporum f. sp. albedinis]